MTGPLAIWLFLFIVAGVAAACGVAMLHARRHPRTQLLSWLMTTGAAAVGIGWGFAMAGAPFTKGLAGMLLLAPFAYPALRLWFAIEDIPNRMGQTMRARAEARRAILRAVPATADAPLARPIAMASSPAAAAAGSAAEPPLPLPPDGVVARLAADPSSRRSRIFNGSIVAVIGAGFAWMMLHEPVRMMVTAPQRVAAHRDMVVAQLDIMGLHDVRMTRDWVQLYCTGGDGEAYAWTSEPADGRACVRDAGVQIKVDRSRLAKHPFARPAT